MRRGGEGRGWSRMGYRRLASKQWSWFILGIIWSVQVCKCASVQLCKMRDVR